jgi:hypothetical protein
MRSRRTDSRAVQNSGTPTYAELSRNPVTRDLGVVKGRFQGKRDVTDYWPLICDKIIKLNPRASFKLANYRFDK